MSLCADSSWFSITPRSGRGDDTQLKASSREVSAAHRREAEDGGRHDACPMLLSVPYFALLQLALRDGSIMALGVPAASSRVRFQAFRCRIEPVEGLGTVARFSLKVLHVCAARRCRKVGEKERVAGQARSPSPAGGKDEGERTRPSATTRVPLQIRIAYDYSTTQSRTTRGSVMKQVSEDLAKSSTSICN